MKIAVLANYPTYRFGKELGISLSDEKRVTSWNETLINALTKLNGVEVHVITLCKAKQTTVVRKGALTVTFLAVPRIMNVVTLYRYTALKAIQIIRYIKPDIVHGIGTEHIWPTVALMSGCPTLVTVHGIINNIRKKLHFSLFSRKKWYFELFSIMEQRVMRQAKYLISINPYVIASLGKFTNAIIYQIENPVSYRFFNVVARPGSSKKILFVGDTGRRKHLMTLLRAFAHMKDSGNAEDWHIAVVGPASTEPYHNKIMNYIHTQNLEDEVVFNGFMLPDDLAKEYRSSALLALSSIEETAPMCIAEAMATGLPVIATNVAGIPFMVADKQTGFLFSVKQSSEMAEHLGTLMDAAWLREKMGKRAKLVARERWYPDHIAQQTLNLYNKILGK